MKRYFFLLLGLFTCLTCKSQLQRLKVSKDHHHLITADGRPFFWVGDTGWELFHKLNKEYATTYFRKRSEQGFNVIQAVALAELDGLHTPNVYGNLPFMDEEPVPLGWQ